MGLYAVLLICLSQAQFGRIWAQERTDDTSLRIDGGSSEMGRTYRDQQPSIKHGQNRAVRNALGGGLDIDTLPDNMTHVVEDSQRYYRWRSYGPGDRRMEELWVDLSAVQQSKVRVHGILSNTHRQAARVALSFDFPFYGHYLRQITIATGGFIFTGEITHRMLTATQYIAPLMANFDPSFSKNSTVRYMDNGEVFVVQWDKVRLQGREAEGTFTFQAALHNNGTIAFNYREVPLPVEKINSTEHPVKVGLSDAFMALLPSPQSSDARRRTIYEYHRVEIDTTKIINNSAFEFTPLPTCLQHTTCELCLISNLTNGCGWCNTLQRCSDGIDRHRQEWLDYNCPEEAKEGTCEDYTQGGPEGSMGSFNHSAPEPTPSPEVLSDIPVTEDDTKLFIRYNGGDLQTGPPHQERTEHTAIIAGVVAALILLVALTLLAVYYINTHPTVAPPFYLMQRHTNNYWPSMKFRNQSCHSTYAEVELGGHDKEGFIEAEQCC
ncbi:plexin domain-containing protein 1 isoform X1 [Salmo salar]|uniref:Plexin domain-containing protein 1 isoform X1 n=1 Tax=Salmo salar TaxID=8030 RepID=A0A1S3NFY6_SALSA|nr:plexin domain-containing protein 1 isoform X1 [Salmo salar]|eukprot:XP_014014160.1 PREDICTED: plexin domain-containing protein 1-like isoform X1 [Salmo salar]